MSFKGHCQKYIMQIFKQIQVPGQVQVAGKAFPKAFGPDQSCNFVQLQSLFQEHADTIMKELNSEGALFFRGFKIQSPAEFSSVLSNLGIGSFEYIGGAAVRKLIVGSETMKTRSVEVFTTNEAPP